MALRVWLPLNGTLKNKGISDVTITNNSATFSTGGKIGNKSCNGRFDFTTIPASNEILNNGNFSVSFWAKINSIPTASGEASTYVLKCGAGATRTCLHVAIRSTGEMAFCFYSDDYTFLSSVTPYIGVWTHFAFTYSNLTQYAYINGELVGTRKTGGDLIVGDNSSFIVYNNPTQLNDLRIYDHCLSAKEVKEISQGLVLHYKLDGLSQGNGDNLVTGLTKGGQTTVVNNTIVTSGKNSDTYFKINLSSALTLNKSYTIGIDAENLPDDGYFRFPIGSQGNSSAGYIDIYNGHNESVFIANDVIVNNGTLLMMDDTNRTAWPNQCIFKNFYIYENTSVADSSGYEYDGTITGTLSTESDSNRYEISTHYSGSSYTDTGSGTFNWFDFSQCTLSAWIKPTASVSGWSGSIGVQHNQTAGHKGFSITDYANNFRVVTVNGSYTTIDSGKPLTVGEWHHCAAVLDGTNLKMYYDGSMVKESTVSWGSAAIATDMRFATGVDFPGSDEMFTGNYSDVRMYCTALSAEDILDLYHTSANVDNLHNIHSFEYNEIFTSNLYDFSAPWTYENLTGSTVDTDMGQAIKLVTSSTNQRAYKNVSNIWTTSGKQFVVSFIAKSDIEGIICDMSRSIADFTDKFTLSTKWKRYTGTITVTSTSTSGTLSFRINQSGATVYILDVKLEEANKNLISATKQGEFLENNIDEIEYSTVSKFKKESSNIIAKDFIEK